LLFISILPLLLLAARLPKSTIYEFSISVLPSSLIVRLEFTLILQPKNIAVAIDNKTNFLILSGWYQLNSEFNTYK